MDQATPTDARRESFLAVAARLQKEYAATPGDPGVIKIAYHLKDSPVEVDVKGDVLERALNPAKSDADGYVLHVEAVAIDDAKVYDGEAVVDGKPAPFRKLRAKRIELTKLRQHHNGSNLYLLVWKAGGKGPLIVRFSVETHEVYEDSRYGITQEKRTPNASVVAAINWLRNHVIGYEHLWAYVKGGPPTAPIPGAVPEARVVTNDMLENDKRKGGRPAKPDAKKRVAEAASAIREQPPKPGEEFVWVHKGDVKWSVPKDQAIAAFHAVLFRPNSPLSAADKASDIFLSEILPEADVLRVMQEYCVACPRPIDFLIEKATHGAITRGHEDYERVRNRFYWILKTLVDAQAKAKKPLQELNPYMIVKTHRKTAIAIQERNGVPLNVTVTEIQLVPHDAGEPNGSSLTTSGGSDQPPAPAILDEPDDADGDAPTVGTAAAEDASPLIGESPPVMEAMP